MIWNLNFKKIKKPLDIYCISFVSSYMTKGENMKNLVENAFGDIVERTDYGNHRNQLNLFDNLNETVEVSTHLTTVDDVLDFLFGNNRRGVK